MKKGVPVFLKNIVSVLTSKSLAIKNKVEAMKARVIIFSLLKDKKLPHTSSISHKIHALLLGGRPSQEDVDNLQLVLHNANSYCCHNDYEDDDKYPDLRHSLFDEDDDVDLSNPSSSAIDLVKNSMEDAGEDFSLEDEIDHVADLFILKFHKRMRLQKLESFKRYQDMLERSS